MYNNSQYAFDRAEVSNMFALFCIRHKELTSPEIDIRENTVYVCCLEGFSRNWKVAGYLRDLASYKFEMFENHLLNVFRDEEGKAKQKMADMQMQKDRIANAAEEGSRWAEYIAELFPAIPYSATIQNLLLELAELKGYPDTRSAMAFIGPIRERMSNKISDTLTSQINNATLQKIVQIASSSLEHNA